MASTALPVRTSAAFMRLLSPRAMMASITSRAAASCVAAGPFHTVPTTGSGTFGAVATMRGSVRSASSASSHIDRTGPARNVGEIFVDQRAQVFDFEVAGHDQRRGVGAVIGLVECARIVERGGIQFFDAADAGPAIGGTS